MTEANGFTGELLLFVSGAITAVCVIAIIRKRKRLEKKPAIQTEPPDEKPWVARLKMVLRARNLPDALPDSFTDALDMSGMRFRNQGADYVRTSVFSIVEQAEALRLINGLEERFNERLQHLTKMLEENRSEWNRKVSDTLISLEIRTKKSPDTECIIELLNRDLMSAGMNPLCQNSNEDQTVSSPDETTTFLNVSSLLSEFVDLETAIGAISLCNSSIASVSEDWEQAKSMLFKKPIEISH